MKGGKKAILLPAELYSRVEQRVKVTGFGSVDKYVIFVLEEILKEEEGAFSEEEEGAFSEEEEQEVKKRLRALGYLD